MAKKGRNPVCILVVGLIISVAAFAVYMEYGLAWDDETDWGSSFSATVIPYNNGVPVSAPIVIGAFTRIGVATDSFVVTISWTSTGTSVDWSTFALEGTFRVSFLNQYDNYMAEYSTTFSSFDENGEWSVTLVLGTDVCKPANLLYGGWFLEFKSDLIASVVDTLGQTFTDELNFVGTANILYESGFELDGNMNY